MLIYGMNLKKLGSYLRVNLLGRGPRLIKKVIYRTAVSQRLRNTALEYIYKLLIKLIKIIKLINN